MIFDDHPLVETPFMEKIVKNFLLKLGKKSRYFTPLLLLQVNKSLSKLKKQKEKKMQKKRHELV